MISKTPAKLRKSHVVGLVAVVGAGVCAAIVVGAVNEVGKPLAIGLVLGVCAAALAVQSLLWRRTASLLLIDRTAGVTAARDQHASDVALLAGGFAHEARNTLNALRSRIALLRKRVTDDAELTRRVDQVQEVGVALEDLVTDFLTFGRPAANELTSVSLAELTREVLELEEGALNDSGVTVQSDVAPSVHVLADRRKLRRAVQNLVVNARQAMESGGTLRLVGEVERDAAVLRVGDDGVGIPRASLARVFDTYFSTKADGTGLGLAIVQQTIEGFGGEVTCDSTEGRGTTMTVRLPLASGPRPKQAAAAGTAVAVGESA